MKILIPLVFAVNTLVVSSVVKFEQFSLSGYKFFTVTSAPREDRVGTLYDRFANGITPATKASDVSVKNVNKSWCVMLHDKVLVTVTKSDSNFHKTPAKKLAETWAKNLSDKIEELTPLQ